MELQLSGNEPFTFGKIISNFIINKKIIIVVSIESCGPCKTLMNILNESNQINDENIIIKVDRNKLMHEEKTNIGKVPFIITIDREQIGRWKNNNKIISYLLDDKMYCNFYTNIDDFCNAMEIVDYF